VNQKNILLQISFIKRICEYIPQWSLTSQWAGCKRWAWLMVSDWQAVDRL